MGSTLPLHWLACAFVKCPHFDSSLDMSCNSLLNPNASVSSST
ncbi:hypothetical protein SLEP1_g28014 [Rubroshorea leprosula]|uniref:Uncharacterized protein n=1 Tax=Rubroshorea leprosula TaxID=152421 RepID=A0AAV5K344_9ROSI|nr:hypothetical protein SLEP1_g28014 [Rubroshorea leprosula]